MKLKDLLKTITSNLISTTFIIKQISVIDNELKYNTITEYYNYNEFEVMAFYLESDDIIIII